MMGNKRRVAVATFVAAAFGVGASAALGGEVIGPPGSIGNPGTPKDTTHANSICSFSGLNDFVNGPTDFIVQSYGQDVRLHGADPTDKTQYFPGNSCGPGSNPDRPPS
jgi:hypothetical protein